MNTTIETLLRRVRANISSGADNFIRHDDLAEFDDLIAAVRADERAKVAAGLPATEEAA